MDDCCRYMHLRHQQQQLSLTGGHARRLTLHKMATHNNSQHGHLEPHIFHHTTRGSIAGVLVSLASLKHARSVSAILIYCLLMLSMCILCTSLYFCYYFVACVHVLHPLLYCAGCCLILLALACAFNRLLNLAGLSMCIPHPQRKRTLIFFFNRPQYIHHCL